MLLTLAEAAGRLRLSERTVRTLIKEQKLKAVKAGVGITSAYRIREEWLDEYIDREPVS